MERIPNIHPGEILREDFLDPLGITPYRLARDIGVQQTRVSQILTGQRSITLDTACRLSRYFGTTPEFWLNLQRIYDLEELQLAVAQKYDHIRHYSESNGARPARQPAGTRRKELVGIS